MSPAEADKEALVCSAFWQRNPDAPRCPNHVVSTFAQREPEAGRKAIPHTCTSCAVEMIDTPEGRVLNHYSRLVFPADPPNPTCPNCGTALVPVHYDLRTLDVAA